MYIVIRSNRNISKKLLANIKKQTNITAFYKFNTINYFSFDNDLNPIINVLKSYKKQKFEIVSFTGRQFALTVNKWGYKKGYANEVINLPLKHRFVWFNDNKDGVQSVTPITTKQLNSIIKINFIDDKKAYKMYLDYVNDFLTIDCFAEYYNMNRNEAIDTLKKGSDYGKKMFG